MIDCDIFVRSKENIQPLKGGRNAEKLAKRLTTIDNVTQGENKKRLNEERDIYEGKIREYDGDDPLSPWLDYIVWTQRMFVSGGKGSHIVTLLEKCTKQFQNDERYTDNERYVKLWILYADMCDDPQIVFSHMRKNGIGQNVALFYLAWSLWLENCGKYDLADQALEEGINRDVASVNKLHAARTQLESRKALSLATRFQNSQRAAASNDQENQRAPLSSLRRAPNGAVRRRRIIRRSNPSNSGTSSQPQPSGSSSFGVFVDPDVIQGSTTTLPSQGDGGSQSALQPMEVRNKENDRRITAWNTQAQPSRPVVVRRRANRRVRASQNSATVSSVSVYVDEEFTSNT